jgi:hypothetical protein
MLASVVPTFKINSQEVEDAWQAYRATQLAACQNPALIENKYFLAIQDTAYARFLLNFEAME